jgi:hypothetical protein
MTQVACQEHTALAENKQWSRINRRHQSRVMKRVAKHRRKKKEYTLNSDERYLQQYNKSWRKKRTPENDRHNLHKSELLGSRNGCSNCDKPVCHAVDDGEISVLRFSWNCETQLRVA